MHYYYYAISYISRHQLHCSKGSSCMLTTSSYFCLLAYHSWSVCSTPGSIRRYPLPTPANRRLFHTFLCCDVVLDLHNDVVLCRCVVHPVPSEDTPSRHFCGFITYVIVVLMLLGLYIGNTVDGVV